MAIFPLVFVVFVIFKIKQLSGQCLGSPSYTTCGSSCNTCAQACAGGFCIAVCETGDFCGGGNYYSTNYDCCMSYDDCFKYDESCLTESPTQLPSLIPSQQPTTPTNVPSTVPTTKPSNTPTTDPSMVPTAVPTTEDPTMTPTEEPSFTTTNDMGSNAGADGSDNGNGDNLDYSLIFIIAACAIFCPFITLALARCFKHKMERKNSDNAEQNIGTDVNSINSINSVSGIDGMQTVDVTDIDTNMEGKTDTANINGNETNAPMVAQTTVAVIPPMGVIPGPQTNDTAGNIGGEGQKVVDVNKNSIENNENDDSDSELRYINPPRQQTAGFNIDSTDDDNDDNDDNVVISQGTGTGLTPNKFSDVEIEMPKQPKVATKGSIITAGKNENLDDTDSENENGNENQKSKTVMTAKKDEDDMKDNQTENNGTPAGVNGQ